MEEDTMYLDTGETVTLGEKIGAGSFGEVFCGYVKGRKMKVAVKLESRERVRKCLGHEVSVLSDLQPLPCVPRLLGQGATRTHSYMVLELLGESVNDKFKKCGRIFTVFTVAKLAGKMITALQCLHAMKYVHRDVKPHNFSLTLSSPPEICLIDFGLSKKFALTPDSQCPYGISGTLPFVSLNLHYGCSGSRRDDLEALAYIFVYFLKGKLPWFSPRGERPSEAVMRRLKEDTPVETLCEGLPVEFASYLRYVRGLRFEQEPDYSELKTSFRLLEKRWETLTSGKFDWELPISKGVLKRSGSEKSKKSTATSAPYTEECALEESYSDVQAEDDSLPSKPPVFPLFENSFCKVNKVDSSMLTLSINSTKFKRARKFTGITHMMEVVCASRKKLDRA